MKTVHVERLQGRRFEVSEDVFGEYVVQLFEGRRVLDAACDFETIEAACEAGHRMAADDDAPVDVSHMSERELAAALHAWSAEH
jgi:hypothetical protein